VKREGGRCAACPVNRHLNVRTCEGNIRYVEIEDQSVSPSTRAQHAASQYNRSAHQRSAYNYAGSRHESLPEAVMPALQNDVAAERSTNHFWTDKSFFGRPNFLAPRFFRRGAQENCRGSTRCPRITTSGGWRFFRRGAQENWAHALMSPRWT